MKPALFLVLALAFGAIQCKVVVYKDSRDECSTLLYVELFTLALEGSEPIDLTEVASPISRCSVTDNDGRDLEISFGDVSTVTGLKVKLGFSLTSTGYWRSKDMTVSYNDSSSTAVSLTNTYSAVMPVSKKFSYACSLKTDTTVSNNPKDKDAVPATAVVSLGMFQAQVYGVSDTKFSTDIQCVNWISEGAWMGILAGVITITILILSVMMLLSTSTPDRFETAKSKCLIIPHEH